MRRLPFWILVALTIGTGALLFLLWRANPTNNPVVINGTVVPPVPTLNSNRVAQGATLYARYCAECYGADLEGKPNWKQRLADGSLPPPPHDSSGHTWHHPDTLLLEIIANGGDLAYSSKMPAFRDQLTEDQRVMILEFIKSKWGRTEREYQWWMTAAGNGN